MAPSRTRISSALWSPAEMRQALSKHSRQHKYHHGHALVLSGGPGHTGAARLAARAALRIGAGLVSIAAPKAAIMECACQLTAIMLRTIDTPEALGDLLTDTRINALCLGPALGINTRTRALVEAALDLEQPRGIVLDADALTVFAQAPDQLCNRLHQQTVLTPHAGEFARLFPDLAANMTGSDLDLSKSEIVQAAAQRAGCVIVLKGAQTLVAAPDEPLWTYDARERKSSAWLATAGSGDVLAGMISGLMARGLPAIRAAQIAVQLHVECAVAHGPGLIAEDIPEMLPQVFRQLGI